MKDNRTTVIDQCEQLLFDPPPPHGESATSQAAAKSIEPLRLQLRERVYECIRSAGANGLTDVECQVLLGMQGDTQRPRRRELVKAGKVVCVGNAVRSPSKRSAMVWASADIAKGGGYVA